MHEDYVRNTTMCLHPMKVDLIKSAAVVGAASQNLLQVLVISWQHAFYKKIFIKISFNGAHKIDYFFFKLITVFSYNCKEGCCISYGEDIIGTSKDVAKACSKDHPKCKAYAYSVGKETGHLCKFSNVYSRCRSRDYKACYKYPGYINIWCLYQL